MTQKEGQIIFPLPYQHAQMLQSQVWGVFPEAGLGYSFVERVQNGTPFLPSQDDPLQGE